MIPVNEPVIGVRDQEYVLECLQSGWVSSAGKFIETFESTWAQYCDRQHGVTTSSGTSALQTSLACLELQPGDEVIIPTFTIISCALAVIYNGGTPILVDANPDTWCMNVSQIEERITKRTRAIMAVHIYGHPVDMDPLLQIADQNDLAVIEDAAEAHGAEYLRGHNDQEQEWVRCGSMGTMSVFSFYANKLVTSGEGGMIVTNDSHLAAKARNIRNLCFEPDQRFLHNNLGHNFRMTNMQAALGLAQSERIQETVNWKRRMGQRYTERLSDIEAIQLPIERSWSRQVYWMYGILLDKSYNMTARALADKLSDLGIQTRPFFLGMHAQPALQNLGLFQSEDHPVADYLSENGLYLPSGLALSEQQMDKVCAALHEILT
ncbi:MAG: aminotransferase DegT [Anaerolineaceae bacterium]|nr:MAG: aminotransferase DegT [Anaerolineaceae bacterium]